MMGWPWPWRRKPREQPSRAPERPAQPPACRDCAFFRDDPAEIETALPGLSVFSSGSASVRSSDGLCLMHDRFVTAHSACPAFRQRSADLP